MGITASFPKHWKVVSLDSVVTRLTNGYVGPTREIYVPQGIPYLLARHVKRNRLTFDGKTFVSPEFNEKNSKSILKEGDVLMVQSGHIGETAVVTKEHEGHNCHAMIVITPKAERLLGSYLSCFFHSKLGRSQLDQLETGITLQHLNCRDVKDVDIPLPPIAEQKRIAAIAQKCDRLRRTRRYTQQLSDSYLRSVFLEMFGNLETNSNGWEFCELGDVADIASGVTKGQKFNGRQTVTVPYLRVANVQLTVRPFLSEVVTLG
ncbi:MAG: hypothetical protein DCF22_23175 [Leptolyngbya sp.]|nr:MAG: hypothetical protein DCF22_23175 [Leptolyngbya sp.]